MCRLCDLAYSLFYGFTGFISPASCVLILNQYKSPLSTCTILFIRSVTLFTSKLLLKIGLIYEIYSLICYLQEVYSYS